MQKVCLINFTGSKGGGAQYTFELTTALVKKDIPIVAIISSENEDLDKWKTIGLKKLIIIDTYKTPIELIKTSVFWNKQKQLIKNNLAEFEVTNIIVPMITFWTKRINSLFPQAKTTIVLHDPIAHSGDKNKMALQAFGETSILNQADDIVVLSSIFIDFVEKKYNKKNKVTQIPMGTTNLYREIENKIKTPEYNSDKINFLFFGTISKYKGIGVLAKAYSKTRETIDNVTLTIAGSGNFNEYEDLFKDLNDVTVFNRWILNEEIESFFDEDSVIAILPYLDATQSGVIPVAISYGVPIIASNAGGIVEQLNQYETGVMFETADADDLARVMIEFASNPGLVKQHKMSAISNRERFSWESIADKFIALLDN